MCDDDLLEELEHLAEWQKLAGDGIDFDSIFYDSPTPTDHNIDDFVINVNEETKKRPSNTRAGNYNTQRVTPPKKKKRKDKLLYKKGVEMRKHAMDCIYRNEINQSLTREEQFAQYGSGQISKMMTREEGDSFCVYMLKLILVPRYKPCIQKKTHEWMTKWSHEAHTCLGRKGLKDSLWRFLCLLDNESFTRLDLNDKDVMKFLHTLIVKE